VLIEEVWAGNNHTCGRSNMADLYCWGNNGSGETDPMAEVIDPMPPMAPVHVSFVQTVATLGIAPAHTCAAGPGGLQTQCWGANGYGELMSEDVPPGPYVGTELGSGGIEELAAGRDHTCALIDGTVLCWARNNLGQLGNPADAGPTIVPQTVLLDRPPVTMAAGRDHTCAVVSDGTLRCWGSNAVNQIGDGTIVNATTPVTPAGPPGKVVALTARLDNTCALTEDGEVYCWGDINGTDLGTEIPNGDPLSVPTRVPVTEELPEPIVELDAGRFHVCARSASNRLWCWGSDASEQLGPVDPPDLKRAVEINLECPT
jgi:alpha-tubulin suppressor-like RCC1 family protein